MGKDLISAVRLITHGRGRERRKNFEIGTFKNVWYFVCSNNLKAELVKVRFSDIQGHDCKHH